ncbi:MAG: hypothetical protein AAGI52_06555 [Bacteroidota bacterium]
MGRLLDKLNRTRLRGFEVDRVVLANGDPMTAAYILFWAHIWWAVPLAINPEQLAALDFYEHFPLVRYHVWDGLAFIAAALLRIGLSRGELRWIQVGAIVSGVVWIWADIALLVAFWPDVLTSLVYTALFFSSMWLLYLTRSAWVDAAPPPR